MGGGKTEEKKTLLVKKNKKLFFVIIFIPKLFLLLFLIKLAFLKILVPKISKTDKNWAHYNFLRLLFYVFIFQKNLQSVQKKMKKNEKKHCDLNFWSIWTKFVSKYVQRLQVCAKTSSGLWPPKRSRGGLWPPKNTV